MLCFAMVSVMNTGLFIHQMSGFCNIWSLVCVCVCFYSLLKTLAQIICLMPFHLCSFASCGIVGSNLSWTVQCVVTV